MSIEKSYAKGIAFPFRIGGRGGIAVSKDNQFETPHTSDRLKAFLGTREGQRVMRPTNGLEDFGMLFDHLDPSAYNMVIFKIQAKLREWENNVEITELKIEEETGDNGERKYIILLSYRVKNAREVQQVSLNI